MSLRTISLSIQDNDHCKRLNDPQNTSVFHLETLLPFSEAVKLERGNANVRPPKETKPYKDMMRTVEETPALFHLKNRGITYICNKFTFENAKKLLQIQIPDIKTSDYDDEESPRFGIADGGHTFRVIENTLENIHELKEAEDWVEPYVRVHFIGLDTQDSELEQIVEALNTSTQVKNYTLEDYKGEFDELKDALNAAGLDSSIVAYKENEEKDWHILEIIQRMSCFLKDRWVKTQPISMYRSKDKSLQLFISESSRPEFQKLYKVIRDIVTFPEFIQSEIGDHVEGRRPGKLRTVKKLKKAEKRAGTHYEIKYRMDGALILPMAAAFRELLTLKNGNYEWKINPHEVFRECAADLYDILAAKSKKVKTASQLGFDADYWSSCVFVVMRKANDMQEARMAATQA